MDRIRARTYSQQADYGEYDILLPVLQGLETYRINCTTEIGPVLIAQSAAPVF